MNNSLGPGYKINNRYRIESLIGKGATASVYKAFDELMNREVALKVFPAEKSLEERTKRELRITASLNHPNIVSLYDFLISDKAYVIVMELIDGVSLRKMISKRSKLPWDKAVYISLQIASALEHAHSKQIIHRDLKPENIMITKEGRVKITDFGIASLISRNKELKVSGTLGYMSPEQITGKMVDETSDIFSLGVIMYEMLTGKNPFLAEDLKEATLRTLNLVPDSPSSIEPSVPEKLSEIVMKAIAKDPDFRFQSIKAFLAALKEFQASLALPEKTDVEKEKKVEVVSKKTDKTLILMKTIFLISLFFLVYFAIPFRGIFKGLTSFLVSSAIFILGFIHPQASVWIASLAVSASVIALNLSSGLLLLALLVVYVIIFRTYRRSLSAPLPFTEIFFGKLSLYPFTTFLIPLIADPVAAFFAGTASGLAAFYVKAFRPETAIKFFPYINKTIDLQINSIVDILVKNYVAAIEITLIALSCAFGASVRESLKKKNYSYQAALISTIALMVVGLQILNQVFPETTGTGTAVLASIPGMIIAAIVSIIFTVSNQKERS